MKRILVDLQQQEQQKQKKKRRIIRSWVSENLESSMGNFFDALDSNLLLEIFSRLSPADIIFRAGRVCRRWRRLTHSQHVRQLWQLKSGGDPWFGGGSPWLVLQAGTILLFYDSIQSLLNRRGRQLDERLFRIGPAGHQFEMVAFMLGLVCGKLVDLMQPGSSEIALAVGNPLTDEWQILPPVTLPEKPSSYLMLVRECGSYALKILCGTHGMLYSSDTQAWEPVPPQIQSITTKLHFRGLTNPKTTHRFVMSAEIGSHVEVFNLAGSQVLQVNVINNIKSFDPLFDGVNAVSVAFLPSFAKP